MASRPPNHEFQDWWNRQRERSLHSVFQVEIDKSPPSTSAPETSAGKGRARSARQISWLCILRCSQCAVILISLPLRIIRLLGIANRRIHSSPTDGTSRLYRVIRCFLFLAVVLLGVEVVAYGKGWHFVPPTQAEAVEILEMVYARWVDVRANYLAPPVQYLANVCIILFLVQSVDRLVLVFGCFWIRLRRLRPVAEVDYGGEVDVENGGEEYPMVLLQIPMCNEREVRKISLLGVCFSVKLWFFFVDFDI